MEQEIKAAGSAVDTGIGIANKLWDFAWTDAGLFIVLLIGVFVLSELVIRAVMEKYTLFTNKYTPKQEQARVDIVSTISTPILSIVSSIFFYYEDGIRYIFVMTFFLIAIGVPFHLWAMKKIKDKKASKYGR